MLASTRAKSTGRGRQDGRAADHLCFPPHVGAPTAAGRNAGVAVVVEQGKATHRRRLGECGGGRRRHELSSKESPGWRDTDTARSLHRHVTGAVKPGRDDHEGVIPTASQKKAPAMLGPSVNRV